MKFSTWVIVSSLLFFNFSASALAEDAAPATANPSSASGTPAATASTGTTATSTADAEPNDNNRAKTLAGSKSPWSFQLNFSYSGSSVNHPLSENAPNPGNQVPAPLVSLTGTVSGRYRIDPLTTVGIGLGVTTYQPFEGPKNSSASNPYADIAHNFKIGPFKSRADFLANLYTDNQNRVIDGALIGLTATDESYYHFDFGLTAGLFLELDYNFFRANHESYETDQQTEWDLFTDPYFEFALSKKVNLRSVIGIGSLHNNNQPGSWALYHPKIYQTLGVGIAILDAWFIYPFFQVANYNNVSTSSVIFGFNPIINLF